MNIQKLKQEILNIKSKAELMAWQVNYDDLKKKCVSASGLDEKHRKMLFEFLANDLECKCNNKVGWLLSPKDNAYIHLIEMYRSKLKEFDAKEKKKLRDTATREKLPSVNVRLYGKVAGRKPLKSDSSKERIQYHKIPDDLNSDGKSFKVLASEAFNAIAKDFEAVSLLIEINKLNRNRPLSGLFSTMKKIVIKKNEEDDGLSSR